MEQIHNARITDTEMNILMLYRQEIADESTPPAQWRLIISAAPGGMSSQFERINRFDLRTTSPPTPEYLQEVVAMLVKQVTPASGLLGGCTITIEANEDRVRAFRSRKGAKTLPKAVKP